MEWLRRQAGKSKVSTQLSTYSLLPTCFLWCPLGQSPPLPGDLAPSPEWYENRTWRDDCRNPEEAVHWASHVSPMWAFKSGSCTFPGGTRRCQKTDGWQKPKVKVQKGQCTGVLRPANGWYHGLQSWMLGHCCKEPREHLFYLQPRKKASRLFT